MLARLPAPSGLKAVLLRFWTTLCLVLSYVAVIFPRRLQSDRSRDELHPTAYLDALRGYAAWIVYNLHVIRGEWQPQTFPARLLFKGIAMVDVFFVISGFALSYSVVGAMYRNPAKVLDSLAGSMFRRYLRLYLPVIFAMFVAFLVVVSGLGVACPECGPTKFEPTFWANFQAWVVDTIRFCDPFAHVFGWISGPRNKWLELTWTIPVEFRGSMLVFIFCAMVCKMKPWARTATIWFGMAAALWWQAPYGTLFLGGMWLADQRHWRASQQSAQVVLPTPVVMEVTPSAEKYGESEDAQDSREATALLEAETDGVQPDVPRPLLWRRRFLRESPYIFLFALSLWLFAGPTFSLPNSPFPFNWISHTMPPTYPPDGLMHWHLIPAALMCVYALDHSPILQWPFLCSFSQCLGELSFGIYLMHQPSRWIVWERALLPWQISTFGQNAGRLYAFLPGYFLMTLLVLWAAELFRRVDAWCVRFSKTVKDWMFV